MSDVSLIPPIHVIEARIAEIERELSELRALLKLARRIEAKRAGGKPEEMDGALPFMQSEE